MPTLSLCMIVRDEAKLLPEFLKHVHGLADQLVAVDTGSADNSRELLAAAGAEVHQLPWQDDFSLARNESLRHARGDWILVLDADEFPQAGFREEVRALIGRDRVGAANITRHDGQRNGIVRVGKPLRLFRRADDIRYRCRIHEDASDSVIAMLKKTGRECADLATPVIHVGYLPERMKSKAKLERDERLLRLAMADDPDDLYSRYKLLEQYRFWERKAEMAPLARECLALIERGIAVRPPHIAGELVEMMRQGLHGDDRVAGLSFLQAMAPVAAHTGHYQTAIATLYEAAGQLENAFGHFAKALELAPGDPARRLVETRALTGLARLSLAIGDLPTANEFTQAAAAISPDDPEVRMALDFLAGALK